MSNIAALILLTVNTLAFFVSFGVLMLVIWQRPAGPLGWSLVRFMASLSLLNLSVVGAFVSIFLFGEQSYLGVLMTNLSILAFALSSLMAFGLIIHAAGKMREFWQVFSRAGVVALVVFQFPLWRGDLFLPASSVTTMMDTYTLAGFFAALVNVIYLVIGLVAAYVWRRRINQPLLLVAVTLILIGQLITLFIAPLRQIAFPSLLSSVAGFVIGYVLIRLQFFDPLVQRAAQLRAIRELTDALSQRRNLQTVLDAVVTRTHEILKPNVVLVFLVDADGKLVVSGQEGGAVTMRGRSLQRGEGLAGRVLELQSALDVPSYRDWDGQAEAFKDQGFCASLSVPMLDGAEIVGVLNLHESAPGRVFSAKDKAIAEMMAAQAGLCIMHERMRYELDNLRARAKGVDKRTTTTIHFDADSGELILGE